MSGLVFSCFRNQIVKMHPKVFAFLILLVLPTSLFAQVEGKNILGGGFRLDRLSYEKSYDGVRKDIDLGINAKYLRSLFPVHASDSIHYDNINDSEKPLSRHWAGITLGLSGYYVSSDSVIIKATDISLGPTLRYYATKQLFLETTALFLHSWSQTKTVATIGAGNWYIPKTVRAGLKCQLGVGYSKRLARNVYLEPFVGYQIYWRWRATYTDQKPYKLIDTSYNFIFSLTFQYSF
jgi:hypothetical protein